LSAGTACTNDACFCPTVIEFAPACTDCLATVNATESVVISTVFGICALELSMVNTVQTTPPAITSTIATPLAVACPQCDIIESAATSCTNDQCFCPTLVQLGPACTSCLATVNATAASIIGSALMQCQLEVSVINKRHSFTHTQPYTSPHYSQPYTCPHYGHWKFGSSKYPWCFRTYHDSEAISR
jgi:hypothetical protein